MIIQTPYNYSLYLEKGIKLVIHALPETTQYGIFLFFILCIVLKFSWSKDTAVNITY